MMKVTRSRFVASLALGAAVAFGGASRVQAQAQAAVINGRVTSDQGRPLQAVNVFITELSVSVGTNEAGNYTITIPAARVSGQTVNMRVRAVGFSPQSRPVTITSGTQTVNWELKADILRLSEVVVTGVSAATEQVKVPFAVAKVDTSQMPVSGTNALSQLQGKVAGVTVVSASGRPGSAPSVVLRGPVSMNAQGRSQQPLYIVDGVLLNGAIPDLNPNDIASFEVVKGAAAASLYGARGGAGVINITTKTGRNAQQGMKFGVRTEAGAGDIERDWPISNQHALQMSPNGQLFCTTEAFGASQCARYVDIQDESKRINDQPADAALPPVSFKGDAGIARAALYPQLTGLFQANTWPKTHDPVGQIVTPSAFSNTTVDLRGRINLTGVYASIGHLEQQAPVRFLDGFSRSSGRVNVDHSFSDRLSAHINTYYSRSEDNAANHDAGGTGGLFFQVSRTPAYVNLLQRDQLGRLFVRSNPLNQGDQNASPLYNALYNKRTDQSTRFIGGTTLRYSPLDFLNFEGNFSYDRGTGQFTAQRDRGYRTTSADAATNSGFLSQGSNDNTSLNTSISGTASRTFFTDLVTRLNARYLYNQTENTNQNLQGIGLAVPGLVTADAVTQNFAIGSNAQQIKEIGMFTSADLEYKERYILQGAIRRDGSSLFGPQNRWKNFGRVSGAWIASAEPWWFTPNALNLFKLRASYGQSGQRPAFASQYETFTIGAGGTLNPATLGNKELKPEINTELEVGTDIQLFNRIGVNLTYAHARIDDQILPVRPPTATGFAQRWENVGEIENKTWELTLDLPVLERRNLSWTQRIIWDRTRSFVKRLDIAPFTDDVVVGNTYTVFQYRQGERIGTFYGVDFARDCSQLPAPFSTQCGGSGSQFQKNSDGYIVWTGGRPLTEGVTNNLWSTQLPGCLGTLPANLNQEIACSSPGAKFNSPWGAPANWGMPIVLKDPACAKDCSPSFLPLGNGIPDFHLAWSQNFNFKRFGAYALLDGNFGQDVWNIGYHWSLGDFMTKDQDQAGKSVEEAKPIGYYWRRGAAPVGGNAGVGGFYDALGPNRFSVEDASYVKLRELSVNYRVGQVAGVGDWTLGLVGRNLHTWTDFRGYDPETGIQGNNGGALNSAALTAVAGYRFPNMRTYTVQLSTAF